MMHICVLGAGVVGLATAWALSEAGCEVTIIDGAAGPGQGASAGNGAQLSYNFVAPLASPDTLLHLPAMLLERNGPLQIKPRLDPDFLRWGIGFLRASTGRMVRETTAAQLALAALSQTETLAVEKNAAIDFYRRVAGKLVVYRHPATFATARRQADAQRGMGAEQIVLDATACLAEEPGLRINRADLQGGVFTPSEELGDCAAFCDRLAGRLRERNSVNFLWGEPVSPVLRSGRLVAVRAGGQEIAADQFVLSLGSGAREFARACGFHLPIQAMKGYSITVRPRSAAGELRHSVTDADRKIVFAPLAHESGPVIRVAGNADFVGDDRSIDPARLEAIRKGAREALDVDLSSDPIGWAGLRPMTPDSRPIIGASPVAGLFLNTGHGGLGWTLACGSARLATELLLGQQPSVESAWFELGR
jgi:D-amino-acid dehydrogenase